MPSPLASDPPTGRGHARVDGVPEFALRAHAHDPATVLIAVQGDADLHVAPRLEASLKAAASSAATRVVLDLTEVTLFDSSAIHALLVGRSFADGRETEIEVVCGDPSILRVLEISGITQLFPVHATVAQATDGRRRRSPDD